jgi:hypothetical protein
LEIGGGHHEIFYVIPAGLVGITCSGYFTAAPDRSSVIRQVKAEIQFPLSFPRRRESSFFCHCDESAFADEEAISLYNYSAVNYFFLHCNETQTLETK